MLPSRSRYYNPSTIVKYFPRKYCGTVGSRGNSCTMGNATLTLHRKTVKLLETTPLTLIQIAESTGIGYHWLCKFKRGAFRNPGVNTVQNLYEFLTARKIGL